LDKTARILVVDDDEGIRKTMNVILKDEGYTVDFAATAKEAIQKTKDKAFNLALIDIRLPDIGGIELLRLMKDTVPRVRKIIVTGFPSMQNAINAVNNNADAYLTKPVNPEKLLKTINEQLRQQKNERSFSEQKVVEYIQSRVKELNAE
jgi:DNA-binding NtrC family response regulator